MLVSRSWILGLLVVGSASLYACGSSDSSPAQTTPQGGNSAGGSGQSTGGANAGGSAGETGDDGDDDDGDDTSAPCDQACLDSHKDPGAGVPPANTATDAASGSENIQAVHHIWLGDTDRTGAPSTTAWKDYGFNVDGYDSGEGTFTGNCKPPTGNRKSASADGNDGRDNSFGKNLMPVIQAFATSVKVNQSVSEGAFSLLVDVAQVDPTKDESPLAAQLFAVKGDDDGMGGTKALSDDDWTAGTYSWHPLPEILDASGKSTIVFNTAYIVGGTFVSGSQADIPLNLAISDVTLALTIKKAQISMDIAADGKTATNGNIGGVLNTNDLINTINTIAPRFGSNLCGEIANVTDKIKASSDIMQDGTIGTDQTCDGISIGLGFDTNQVAALGDPAPAATGAGGAASCP